MNKKFDFDEVSVYIVIVGLMLGISSFFSFIIVKIAYSLPSRYISFLYLLMIASVTLIISGFVISYCTHRKMQNKDEFECFSRKDFGEELLNFDDKKITIKEVNK